VVWGIPVITIPLCQKNKHISLKSLQIIFAGTNSVYNYSQKEWVTMAENKQSLSDKVKGTVSKVKGEAKDQIGNARNDKGQQADGKKDKTKGNLQDTAGKIKENPDRH
jgi:uncharacterized protein YjbJ (UPF0337 family)